MNLNNSKINKLHKWILRIRDKRDLKIQCKHASFSTFNIITHEKHKKGIKKQ